MSVARKGLRPKTDELINRFQWGLLILALTAKEVINLLSIFEVTMMDCDMNCVKKACSYLRMPSFNWSYNLIFHPRMTVSISPDKLNEAHCIKVY